MTPEQTTLSPSSTILSRAIQLNLSLDVVGGVITHLEDVLTPEEFSVQMTSCAAMTDDVLSAFISAEAKSPRAAATNADGLRIMICKQVRESGPSKDALLGLPLLRNCSNQELVKMVARSQLSMNNACEKLWACSAPVADTTMEDEWTAITHAQKWGKVPPNTSNPLTDGIAVKLNVDPLELLRFNPLNKPPQEVAVMQLANGLVTHTRGNISNITAQAKAGKSALIAAMVAAAISDVPGRDTLGFKAVNPEKLPVLVIDTEHSPYHFYALCDRVLRRAGMQESGRLFAYRLAGLSARELQDALAKLIKSRRWLFVVLDGVADFVTDVNKPEETDPFVAHLHGLAIEYDTHIICILHLNPGSDTKTRGHLGSQLERKCESNLRIEKSPDGVSVVFSDIRTGNRGGDIAKAFGPRFVWNDDLKMHVSTNADLKPARATKEAKPLDLSWMEAGKEYAAAVMLEKIAKQLGRSERTASNRLAVEVAKGELMKLAFGTYIHNPPTTSKK